ncbi:glycosyltransferase family 4 protein [Ureibacillus acetophenoni]|uniref:Glycosyltransferase involved in cell wall bisynthesis n=1 Tax=Ureibacillus acetophenoni TaxID=614649 RepID=A0A285U9D3_9BACL|nr:glycosyltransferase family 4 protein [Ureibacillus acetophenoni]SOC38429.1 glycosyltransferase involved in cell wall bisynthesis [Ureibacillus acetophenoni]
MKTLWILDAHTSEPKYGGISRQYDFATELSKRGYNVIVIASSYSHFTKNYFTDDEFKISEINSRVHFVYLRTKPEYKGNGFDRLLNMLSFVSLVKKHRAKIVKKFGKPDVVTGCSIHPFAWVAAFQTAKKYKARFCIEVRDLWPQILVQNNELSRFHPFVIFLGSLEKWAYKRAEKIIYSMTYGDKYICDKLGFSKEKTYWIGQPMDCERYDNYAESKKELIPIEIRNFMKDSFVCVFAGYYIKYEGVYIMLEAAKKLQDNGIPIKMLFVGSGFEYEGMLDYVKENKLDNVFVGPRINRECIPSLLKASQICMAHLAHEGNQVFEYGLSKNKINDYLYSGTCTIFGYGQKNDPVATSNAGYVIEPNNVEALFNKIVEVYNMPEIEREKLGENGRTYIQNNHKVQILGDKLEKILFESIN